MDEKEVEKAAKEISEKTDAAMKLIREAEALADAAGIEFSFDVAYGMGGRYYPNLTDEQKKKLDDEGEYYNDAAGWQASSHSC